MKIQLFSLSGLWRDLQKFLWPFSVAWQIRGHIYTLWAAKSKKVMYSITFVILPVTKTIFCTRGCFSASLGLKMNIDSLSWPYGHLRLSNLSFPALVTLENNHSYQKLFPTLGKWQMNEVKYYFFKNQHFFAQKDRA